MDCPDRERGQWIGDVSVQAPQVFRVLDGNAVMLVKKAINDFIRMRNGAVLRGNVPGECASELPSQSLIAIGKYGMISEYVKNTGDIETLKRCYVPMLDYSKTLWDWDSWLTDVAITQVAVNEGSLKDFFPYQKGCIENFTDFADKETGRTYIMISDESFLPDRSLKGAVNGGKPVLIQHALFIAKTHNDFEWLRPLYKALARHLSYYDDYCRHESGLYYFIDDTAIGVDNDPCTFYRPHCSSGSIFLNCLMYKEKSAMAELSEKLEMKIEAEKYRAQAEALKRVIQELCYDERNGFYYSVDLNLLPIDPNQPLHSGCPRNWNTLIQRIDVWSGFMAMWTGIATKEQAERMVKENYLDKRLFYAPWGVRTLSKCEKMYQIVKSGNPSCWLGPIWGVSNYMVFRGLLNYGYYELADELADKTIKLFGRDIAECGEMHEYYDPETGRGVNNKGFQSWNLLCANILLI